MQANVLQQSKKVSVNQEQNLFSSYHTHSERRKGRKSEFVEIDVIA